MLTHLELTLMKNRGRGHVLQTRSFFSSLLLDVQIEVLRQTLNEDRDLAGIFEPAILWTCRRLNDQKDNFRWAEKLRGEATPVPENRLAKLMTFTRSVRFTASI